MIYRTYPIFVFILILFTLLGCKPTVIAPVSSEPTPEPAPVSSEPAPEPPTATKTTEPQLLSPQTTETIDSIPAQEEEEEEAIFGQPMTVLRSFALMSGSWKKYLHSPPEIYAISSLSPDIRALIGTQQKLIRAVMQTHGSEAVTNHYEKLQGRLKELKNAIPSAKTITGYVISKKKQSNVNPNSYFGGPTEIQTSYYEETIEKQKSTSPTLLRSTQAIATNATLKDLDQRIDSLQHLISQWKRKISIVNTTGTTEAISRDANAAYIRELEAYTKKFIKLSGDRQRFEQAEIAKKKKKAAILQKWRNFEGFNLELIRNYFAESLLDIVTPSEGMNYKLSGEQLKKSLILVCEMGSKKVYFEIDRKHPDHPFVLADITPADS